MRIGRCRSRSRSELRSDINGHASFRRVPLRRLGRLRWWLGSSYFPPSRRLVELQ